MKLRYVALGIVCLFVYFTFFNGKGVDNSYTSEIEISDEISKESFVSRYEIGKAFGKSIPDCLVDSIISYSDELEINPLWLFCLIDNESGFRHNIANKQSGAYGYIQFLGEAMKDINVKKYHLKSLNECEQFYYVRQYINLDIKRHDEYFSFADMYFGVLYPKMRGSHEKGDVTMFKNPSLAYVQNKALDKNKDGKVCRNEFAAFIYRKYNKILKLNYDKKM